MDPDVVIVGGGIAGLATAYELKKRGASFVILERASRAGGVILSETVDGWTIDAGPDALLTQKPEAIALCEELGLGDRLMPTTPPRIAYIQRGGRLHPLPAASVMGIPTQVLPFLKTRLFSWPGKLRMGAELFIPPRRDGADESISEFIGRRFGREAVAYLAEPLLAGIYAGDADRLSARALFPRFVQAEQKYGSILRAFRRRAREAARSGGEGVGHVSDKARTHAADGAFKSLPGGLSELVAALVATLPAGALHTNAAVSAISGGDPRFDVTAGAAHYRARALVLATPAFVTSALARSVAPDVAALCGEVSYTSVATVALGFRRSDITHPLNGSGFVVPRVENSGIMAASFLSSKWPHRAPEDRALLRTFVGGSRDPAALEETDEALVRRSLAALTPIVGIRAAPVMTRVYRFPRSNAQHDVGHLARVAALERALTQHPGLFVTGSGFRGTGIPDCVADGRQTAAAVATYVRDQRRKPERTKISSEVS